MADWNGEIASREELRERKRRAALRVASRLFNEKGYHATSLDEIADRIGVTKTALYYYFRNKEELLFDCIETSLKAGESAQEDADMTSADAFERFRGFYLLFLTRVIEDGGCYVTMMNIRALPGPMRERLLARRTALCDYVRDLLDEAVTRGRMREIDTPSTALFLVSAINWVIGYCQEMAETAPDPQRVAQSFLDNLLHGLEAR